MPDFPNTPFFTAPLTYCTLTKELHRLKEEHPKLKVSTLGYSVFGRPIPYLWLGEGKSLVLYVATHHAMEWITGNLLLAFAEELLSLWRQNDSKTAEMLKAFSLVFVPMLNPDGVTLVFEGADPSHPYYHRQLRMNGDNEDFSHWQANARGVDLNHNYSAGFSEYQAIQRKQGILSGGPTLYSGLRPESEPEVAALAGLIRILRPVAILTLHTQGEEIYYDSENATPKMHKMAHHLSALTGYTLGKTEGTGAFGGLTEWAVRCGIPSFTLECGKGQNPLPLSMAKEMYSTLRPALLTLPSLSLL